MDASHGVNARARYQCRSVYHRLSMCSTHVVATSVSAHNHLHWNTRHNALFLVSSALASAISTIHESWQPRTLSRPQSPLQLARNSDACLALPRVSPAQDRESEPVPSVATRPPGSRFPNCRETNAATRASRERGKSCLVFWSPAGWAGLTNLSHVLHCMYNYFTAGYNVRTCLCGKICSYMAATGFEIHACGVAGLMSDSQLNAKASWSLIRVSQWI